MRIEGFDHLRMGDTIVVTKAPRFKVVAGDWAFQDVVLKKAYYIRLPEGDIEVAPPESLTIRNNMKEGEVFTIASLYKKQTIWERITKKPKVLQQFKVVEVFPTMTQYEAID
jgi:hypothetical protein